MRNICKMSEPRELTQYRCQPDNEGYDVGYRYKSELLDALISEQRGLCCYCMSHITQETAHVEHWYTQKMSRTGDFPDGCGDLDYKNLLAVCLGSINQHCDKSRPDDKKLKYNPAIHDVEAIIEYESNGTISSTDDEFKEQLNNFLKLNCHFLIKNRWKELKGFTDGYQKQCRKNPKGAKAYLQKQLGVWDGTTSSGELKKYCQIVVFWIKTKLRRNQAT